MEDNKAILEREAFERFAVKYWGTKTLYVGGVGLQVVGKGGWNLKHPDFYLQLRSIDSLTDEECVKIADILSFYSDNVISEINGKQIFIFDRYNEYRGSFNTIKINRDLSDIYSMDDEDSVCNYDTERLLELLDYLRSIGVLVPADGYTVEEIIDMGWAKI